MRNVKQIFLITRTDFAENKNAGDFIQKNEDSAPFLLKGNCTSKQKKNNKDEAAGIP